MSEIFQGTVGEVEAGLRLDVYLAGELEDASRSYLAKLVKEGNAKINGHVSLKPSRTVVEGDEIELEVPPPPPAVPEAEDIPLEILYEDEDLLLVNKPSGMVVHPAPGHYTGTLVNAVLFHCQDFQRSGGDMTRPGIVHRLDRDTSGVMVVAKNQYAHAHLSRQASEHTFDRRYLALVRGEFPEERGRINAGVGRSLTDPGKMAVTGIRARDAVTNFEVLEKFKIASLVSLQLETGRTHQIRVHMRFAGRPVLGDPLYGVTDFKHWKVDGRVLTALEGLEGQALHAERLGVTHPRTGERLTYIAPVPPDFQRALDVLRELAPK